MRNHSLRRFVGLVSCATAMAFVSGAGAHHSVTAYDLTTTKELAGTVKEFQWTNPHSWIQLMIADETGKEIEWSIECGTPNFNSRQGWKRSDLRPGDKVAVRVHPMRDGTAHGTLVDVKLNDGRVLKGPTYVIGSSSAPQE